MLAELTAAEKQPRQSHRRGWLAVAAVVAMAAVLTFLGLRRAATVDVNFVTEPYEATINLDGEWLHRPDGALCRTPCTVRGVAVGAHHVVFQWDTEGGPLETLGGAGKVDAGVVDFAENRQINVRVKSE